MKIDLQEIVKKVAEENDQSAFQKLFDHYFPGLFSYALSIIKNNEECEEIIFDVFCKVWITRAALPSVNNLTSYLYTSTKNTCLNAIKSKSFRFRRKTFSLEDFGDKLDSFFMVQDDQMISAETITKINEAIQTLPPKCKLVFRLVKDENMKYADVANLLGISIKGVERQMTIAFQKLAGSLENDLAEFAYFSRKKLRKNL